MTNEERQELEALKEKCIDKRSGHLKKSAETADLERLQILLKLEEAPAPASGEAAGAKEELKPLTPDEVVEMQALEARARQGRQNLHPTPHEMRQLGKLRERAKVK